jgi:hypothetical protein
VIKDFTKLANIMATIENKFSIMSRLVWILMLRLTKKYMVEYKTLFVKMALDNPPNQQAMLNYEYFCYLQLLFGLACILPLLKSMHNLSSLHNPKIGSYMTLWQPSMFVKVMFAIRSMIKLSSSF